MLPGVVTAGTDSPACYSGVTPGRQDPEVLPATEAVELAS